MKKTIFFVCVLSLILMTCKSSKKSQSDASNPKPDKLCALTFDDGPDSKKTPLILDKLEKYGVVASFFMIGQLINDSTKPVIDRIKTMGCEIDNHSWAWSSMNNMTKEQIKKSEDDTSSAIQKYAGVKPAFFRPPNLAVSDTMYDVIDLPFAEGVLGMDWDGCGTSAGDRAKNVLSGMRDGAIILLHDVQSDPHPTPESLDILIPELKKQGYEFVTLSELFKRKGIIPDPKEKKMWKYVE